MQPSEINVVIDALLNGLLLSAMLGAQLLELCFLLVGKPKLGLALFHQVLALGTLFLALATLLPALGPVLFAQLLQAGHLLAGQNFGECGLLLLAHLLHGGAPLFGRGVFPAQVLHFGLVLGAKRFKLLFLLGRDLQLSLVLLDNALHTILAAVRRADLLGRGQAQAEAAQQDQCKYDLSHKSFQLVRL